MTAKKDVTPEPTVPAVFEIEDESVLKRGREATPSEYFENVRDAVHGKAYGVKATTPEEATKILNELRKAGNQTGLKLRTWNKSETEGYVAWKVVAVRGDETAKVEEAPVAE